MPDPESEVQQWYGKYHAQRARERVKKGWRPLYAAPHPLLEDTMNRTARKEVSLANQEQYRAVLDDLLSQRNELQYRVGEIEAAISALRKLMPHEDAKPTILRQTSLDISNGRYAGMSVRWGILQLLSEDATGPMTTGNIAEALRLGGIKSDGKNFAANVSAVLSDMNRSKQEVENTPNGFIITAVGRSAWVHIKPIREAKLAGSSSPSVFQQPVLQ